MSITHRDVHDADVAAVLHLIREEAQREQLRREGRLAAPTRTVGE